MENYGKILGKGSQRNQTGRTNFSTVSFKIIFYCHKLTSSLNKDRATSRAHTKYTRTIEQNEEMMYWSIGGIKMENY